MYDNVYYIRINGDGGKIRKFADKDAIEEHLFTRMSVSETG